MKKQDYEIMGHPLEGRLGIRLSEPGVSRVNDAPGFVVRTAQGLYYCEIMRKGESRPVSRKESINLQAFVEAETRKYVSKQGRRGWFSVKVTYDEGNHQARQTDKRRVYSAGGTAGQEEREF